MDILGDRMYSSQPRHCNDCIDWFVIDDDDDDGYGYNHMHVIVSLLAL